MIPIAAIVSAPTPARLALGALVAMAAGAAPAGPFAALGGAQVAEERSGVASLLDAALEAPAPATAGVLVQPGVAKPPVVRLPVSDDFVAPPSPALPAVASPARFFPASAPRAPPLPR